EDVPVGGRHGVLAVEALPHGVERARADVAVDDPQGAEREEGEPLALRVLGVPPRVRLGGGLRRVLGSCGHGAETYHSRTCIPSSTTRSGGMEKNSVGRWAMRERREKSFSRQSAIPGSGVARIDSRATKKRRASGSIARP